LELWVIRGTNLFQDDKKFQGELFGICNLFRDLSDKLFTSEIIEMHGEHEKDKTSEATGIREIVDTDLFGTQEKMKSPAAAIGDDNQTLADCGKFCQYLDLNHLILSH
jgi:hypothetical protein